jgi:SAM-dependent methyltransferase
VGARREFLKDLLVYRRQAIGTQFPLQVRELRPIVGDKLDEAGSASGAYFHQDLWAARKIFARRPTRHLDVGSRIDGFVAHVLTFMPVEVIDIRPLTNTVTGLKFIQEDGASLATIPTGSAESVSSLHAVEHFGLGRYGDPIDPTATFAAMESLARVLKPGGYLYFSVPIGRERVAFNAHRIFAPTTVIDRFTGLTLESFAAVDESGQLFDPGNPSDYVDADYSCGLFEFRKPDSPT